MNGQEIFLGLSYISRKYIEEAETETVSGGAGKAHRIRRPFLLAAVIALALLLVGCAVVYVLRMQSLKVGEFSFYIPTEYDENGEAIPMASHEPITLLSRQGTNMEALKEWIAFKNSYDQDSTVMIESDLAMKSGHPWDIPENYYFTYDCYSPEMVDKLNEIVEKYDLKLLSTIIQLDRYEGSVPLDSLGLTGLTYDEPNVQVEYEDGSFHLEGTFHLGMRITGDFGDWQWENGEASVRYSLKDYFDPSTGAMLESKDYDEWDYTRRDGKTVLLVLNEDTAEIFADLPDAFITIDLDSKILVDGKEVPMTRAALEQLAELFDLSIQPHPTTMEQVEKYKADAEAAYEAERAAERAEHEEKYALGYQAFVNYRLEKVHTPESLSYILYDLNGDGVDKLIINGWDILSMKDGESYRYFNLNEAVLIAGKFVPCEKGVFEVYTSLDIFQMFQYNYYQANPESAEFLTGVVHDTIKDKWYRSLDGSTENIQSISEAEARSIMDAHPQEEIQWLPLVKFGQPYTYVAYSDPYAAYIANVLDRFSNGEDFTYTLMDLNGDVVQELITKEPDSTDMQIFTILDGELKEYADDISYICEGNILEECEIREDKEDRYYGFYRCGAEEAEFIEKVVRDPYTLYWGHALAGQDGKTIREDQAWEIINSYKHIDLTMKSFTEYPLR